MRRLIALIALLVVAGCGSPTEPHSAVLSLLRQAETIWTSAALSSYSFIQERSCDCPPEAIGPVRLTVEVHPVLPPGGAAASETLVSAVYVEGGAAVPAGHGFLTVRQLFELIRDAARNDADVIEVGFHPIYGYPSDVLIDYDRGLADDEVIYTSYGLEDLDAVAASRIR